MRSISSRACTDCEPVVLPAGARQRVLDARREAPQRERDQDPPREHDAEVGGGVAAEATDRAERLRLRTPAGEVCGVGGACRQRRRHAFPNPSLGAELRLTESFQRLARPPLVEQLPRRGVALGGAAQTRPRRRARRPRRAAARRAPPRPPPATARPARPPPHARRAPGTPGRARARRRARTPSRPPRGSRSGRTGRASAGRTASRRARSAIAPRRSRRVPRNSTP